MSENSATTYTVLHLRFKLRVPPHVLLAHSREAARIISSVEGLIWKIWVLQEEEFEMGGIYLFANRETAEAYLNHPVIQVVRSNPAVVSSQSQLWDVESALSANLGHKLGLYRAMAESGPINSDELARRTATDERSVREWLHGQVAGGYVRFDATTNQYSLPPEHAFVLANPDSPAFLPPAFDVAGFVVERRSRDPRRVPLRQRNGLARTRLPAVQRDRGLFS